MGLVNYLMGTDARKSLKKLGKIADSVEAKESYYAQMSDEELKSQTAILKGRLSDGETLDDILPDAFAALREAAWRVLKMKHFRVDKMDDIDIVCHKREGKDAFKELKLTERSLRMFSMFSGKVQKVKIRFSLPIKMQQSRQQLIRKQEKLQAVHGSILLIFLSRMQRVQFPV